MTTTILPVQHPTGEYNIFVGANLYDGVRVSAEISPTTPLALISDTNVGPLYGNQFANTITQLTIPAGEQYKNLNSVHKSYAPLIEAGLDRSGAIVALGGGVIGDMSGFIAASFMRGVGFIQCPTTLLSMVDASIGGKTGVDLPQGKNLVGAFKQPLAVLVDLETLRTLPVAEFASGMAEVIKAGLIADPQLFNRLEQDAILTKNSPLDALKTMVVDAIEVKRQIVQEDPFEHGRRALLNLGHTFGHAIEHVSHYELSHGYSIAMGMVVAAKVSAELGHADPAIQSRIETVCERYQLPIRIPNQLDLDQIMTTMTTDKKKKSGKVRYILLRDVGDCFLTPDVPNQLIRDVITSLREPHE